MRTVRPVVDITKSKEFLRKTRNDRTLGLLVCAYVWAFVLMFGLNITIPLALRVVVVLSVYPAILAFTYTILFRILTQDTFKAKYHRVAILRKNIEGLKYVKKTKFRDLEHMDKISILFRQDKKLYSFFKSGLPRVSEMCTNLTLLEKYYSKKLTKEYCVTLDRYITDLTRQIEQQVTIMCTDMGRDWVKDETPCVWYINANPEQLNLKYLMLSYDGKALRDNAQGVLADLRQRLFISPKWVYEVAVWNIMTETGYGTFRGRGLVLTVGGIGECADLYGADTDYIQTMFDPYARAGRSSLQEIVAAANVI